MKVGMPPSGIPGGDLASALASSQVEAPPAKRARCGNMPDSPEVGGPEVGEAPASPGPGSASPVAMATSPESGGGEDALSDLGTGEEAEAVEYTGKVADELKVSSTARSTCILCGNAENMKWVTLSDGFTRVLCCSLCDVKERREGDF